MSVAEEMQKKGDLGFHAKHPLPGYLQPQISKTHFSSVCLFQIRNKITIINNKLGVLLSSLESYLKHKASVFTTQTE